jgi:hypothetical protein
MDRNRNPDFPSAKWKASSHEFDFLKRRHFFLIFSDAMSSKKSRSDMISAAVNQYLLQRGITQGREEVKLNLLNIYHAYSFALQKTGVLDP